MSHVFFAQMPEVAVGSQVELSENEGHHAVRVRRVRVGETVELVDGHGVRAIGDVCAVGAATCTIDVTALTFEPVLAPALTVVQALVKRDRSDQAMELLTETGVDTVIPWAASRSQSHVMPTKWPRIAIESAKQSRRARFPVVTEVHTTSDVAALIRSRVATGAVALLCHESADTSIVEALASIDSTSAVSDIIIVVGPEGGLTQDELATCRDAGATAVVMGPSVMRAATAGAAAASIVSALTPRWRKVLPHG